MATHPSRDPLAGRVAIDYKEAAPLLGMKQRSLLHLIHTGQVPGFKIGRRVMVSVEALRDLGANR